MTPPLLRSFGRQPGGELGTGGSRLDEIRISPELRRLSEVVSRSQNLASARGRESLASITAACADRTDCSPDLSLLPAAIEHTLTRARSSPGYYRMALNFLAAQLMSTTDPAEQERLRTRAREVARDALTAISNPGFNPPPEDAERLDEPVRTKTRMLFDISCTLSALLAQPTREGYSEADRGLLRDYFHQMLSGMEQTRIRSAINPNSPAFPDYFESFVRAQLAMLDNDREGAFRQLLATRALFRAMPADRRGRALPLLVETSTELALQSMPRDAAGEHVESLRSLISLEALSYFYQVDFAQSHAENELPTAQRQGAALTLVAGVYLGAGLEAVDAGSLIERLAELGERRGDLTAALQRRYDADEEFRRGLSNLYSGNLSDASRRSEVFEAMLRDAETVARHLRAHRDAEPYAAVLSRDTEGRPLRRAVRALERDAELTAEFRDQLGLAEGASAESVARRLCEMGALLPVFLNSLPDLVRENPSHRSFFDAIRNAARGYREDGMRVNVEAPLVDLLEELHRRARDDDRYAPAYHAVFQSIAALERIAPDATLSPALRQSARRYAEELSRFSWRRVGRHLAAPESVGMLLAGVALTELAPVLLLRGAGTAGELGPLVRGGQVTGWGEFAVGAGVGFAMQAGGLTLHMAFNRAPGVSISQEFGRIGLGSLAFGTVFSMLAMGGTVWGGRLLRRGLLPEGAALGPGRLALGHVGLRLGNWTIGGGLMLGAHSATAALTGHAAMPTGENVAEMFLTMALWDVAAAGLRFGLSRTRFWRHQIGPFRADQMVRNSLETMVRRAPELSGQREFLEAYLQVQIRNPRRFQEIARALERGEIPRLEGEGRARRLIFTAAPLSTEDPLSRTGAARAILQLDESGADRLRRILDSEAFAGHPEGIGPVRALIRQRLANGERRPRIWVRAYLEGDSISFEILQRQPADGDRENTFTMDPNGIRNLQTDDPVLRAAIIGYQNQMFTPILPPSAGHSARTQARPPTSEEPTAAHRPPRPTSSEPASPGGDAPEAPPAEPVSTVETPSEPVAPVGAPSEAPVENAGPARTPSTVSEASPTVETIAESPVAPAETGTASESLLDVTAPQQPTQALLDAARRTSPGLPGIAEVPAAGGRPRRGDETVPFSTQQAQRARTASRPDIPVEQAETVLQGDDPATTRRIPAEEARELRERLARLDGAEGDRPETELEPSTRAAGESEAPIELQEGDFAVQPDSIAPPAEAPRAEAPSAEDPFSFADLNEPGEAPISGGEGVTLRPPRVPAEAVVRPPPIPAQPRRGPPPLPRRTPPEALAEAIERESASAEPILLIRRRLEGLRPSPTRTAGVRIPSPEGYDAAAARMDRFFAELYAEVQDRGRQQAEYNNELAAEGLGPQELPYLNLFTVEVSPRGEMRIVSNVENLRYRDHSYFTLRRVAGESHPDRFTFRIEEGMNMTDEMETAGWRDFLMRLFN